MDRVSKAAGSCGPGGRPLISNWPWGWRRRVKPERPATAPGRRWRRSSGPAFCRRRRRLTGAAGGARPRRHDGGEAGRSPGGPLARDPILASGRHLRTAADAAGEDAEGIGWGSPARCADGARSSDVPTRALMAKDFAIIGLLVRPGRPRIRFLSIKSRLCSTLPSDPASQRRPCASLILRRHQAG